VSIGKGEVGKRVMGKGEGGRIGRVARFNSSCSMFFRPSPFPFSPFPFSPAADLPLARDALGKFTRKVLN